MILSLAPALVYICLAGIVVGTPSDKSGDRLGEEMLQLSDGMMENTDITVDPAIEAREKTEKAAATYERLRAMQYEGDIEDNIYPVVMQTASEALEALQTDGCPQDAADRNAGILADLSPQLVKACVFYSGRGDGFNTGKSSGLYVDVMTSPQMNGQRLSKDPDLFPQIVYIAASSAYNTQQYEKALEYFETYMRTGDSRYRQPIARFMAQTAQALGVPKRAVPYVSAVVSEYPSDTELLGAAIRLSVAAGETDGLQELLDRALIVSPNDEELLRTQAFLYESRYEYKKALDIWNVLYDKHPDSLNVNEHLTQAYYNLGVGYYNESINSENEKEAKRLRRQSKSYFESSIPKLQELLANLPSSEKYLRALGVAYGCLEMTDELEKINNRLQAQGRKTVVAGEMPGMIVDESAAIAATSPSDIPSFNEFAQEYITGRFGDWVKKGEFESLEDYNKRMTKGGTDEEYNRLLLKAEEAYFEKYASRMRVTDMKISPYDTSHETFLIETSLGSVVLNVPMKNREAEMFKSNWNAVQIRNPRYMIKDDRVGLASITFRTPAGKNYVYNAVEAADYSVPYVKVDLATIIENGREDIVDTGRVNATSGSPVYIGLKSDVDEKIPITNKVNNDTYVLIIANEEYQKVPNVASAFHDGDTFREYCVKTLGIPDNRVFFYPDATLNGIYEGLETIKNKVRSSGPQTNVIFYYAGHGLPEEKTKSAYMLPVDAHDRMPKTWVPMKEVYKELTSVPNAGVIAFVDACFSGSARSADKEDVLTKDRGVALKPKEMVPTDSGSLFVLTAASGNESALPYKEKNHGLFTYYLLKKLQDSKGNATLNEISDYVTKNVKETSESKYNKGQTPTVMTNGEMSSKWEKVRLR